MKPGMNAPLVRTVDAHAARDIRQEWLVANGLGGYASGTVLGPPARAHHGLLVAALAAPLGRVVMLNHLQEWATTSRTDARDIAAPEDEIRVPFVIQDFRLSNGLPIWRYKADGAVLEKSVFMPRGQNTVHVVYSLLDGPRVKLYLLPYVNFRSLTTSVDQPLQAPYALAIEGERCELRANGSEPALRMCMAGAEARFVSETRAPECFYFAVESQRGYASKGLLWSPGTFSFDLAPGMHAAFTASTEPWTLLAAHPALDTLRVEQSRRVHLLERAAPTAQSGLAAELVLAADAFVVTPAVLRAADPARAHAADDDVRSIIAGYHWFTDWGRDTMISLEGLTLVTGRFDDCRRILRTFAHYIRDGLIPNLFPEGKREGLYHTADATLWFFHALDRYLRATDDRATLRLLLPKLFDVFEHHVGGTQFGIGVDPEDGLLREGAHDWPLTWMDAKVGDWIVTPRRGKAVEINGLWYNALRLLEGWLGADGEHQRAERVSSYAARAYDAFNRRFWYGNGQYLYDVVDGAHGDDASLRPNQILTFSLAYPVLSKERWRSVFDNVAGTLLTPRGLRTLAPNDPEYRPRYDGDVRARDAAYHQGTVWPWLLGPFCDAWLKVYPDERRRIHESLQGFSAHLSEAGIGSVSEIFDAEPPFRPRGCIAQAWSVAEILRVLMMSAPE